MDADDRWALTGRALKGGDFLVMSAPVAGGVVVTLVVGVGMIVGGRTSPELGTLESGGRASTVMLDESIKLVEPELVEADDPRAGASDDRFFMGNLDQEFGHGGLLGILTPIRRP